MPSYRLALKRPEDIPESVPFVPEPGSVSWVHYSEADPGAVGAGHIWIRSGLPHGSAMFVRSDADDEWLNLLAANLNEAGTAVDSEVFVSDNAVTVAAVDATGTNQAEIVANDGAISLTHITAAGLRQVILNETGLHVGVLGGDGAGGPVVLSGAADPSAASGLAAPEGSVYMRTTATAGQVWIKTGAADTGWTRLATV